MTKSESGHEYKDISEGFFQTNN